MNCKMSESSKSKTELYPAVATYWGWMPPIFRRAIAWTTVGIFSLAFFGVAFIIPLFIPFCWRNCGLYCKIVTTMTILSYAFPLKEWPFMRKVGQLWFEIFSVSSNLSPEQCLESVRKGRTKKHIYAMSPHGIIPFHALIWASYSDLYYTDPETGDTLYGFAAVADAVSQLPFLRNMISWFSCGPADYKTLKDGLEKGIVRPANAIGRKPKDMFILPGGVAEVFLSSPGRHEVYLQNRMGLIKLALETGASLVPVYTFGASDFYHNLSTSDSFLARLSRKYRLTLTVFWGQMGTFFPFPARITFVVGDEIPVQQWKGDGPVPREEISKLHAVYLAELTKLFDRYKAVAGYPDASLVIH